MEIRITKKVNSYILNYQQTILKEINIIKQNIINNSTHTPGFVEQNFNQVYGLLCNYPKIYLDNLDFEKRKRVKNTVPVCECCRAKRANGLRCTRRRKAGLYFCGTHEKGIPHGKIDDESITTECIGTKISVWLQDIDGILCYIDANHNSYQMEDIMQDKISPRVISKYTYLNGQYHIIE
jgi:hypothetical protein